MLKLRRSKNVIYSVIDKASNVRQDDLLTGVIMESVNRVVSNNIKQLNSFRSPRVSQVERQRIRKDLIKETGIRL